MAIPLVVMLTFASQGLPVVATAATWGRRPPAPYVRLSVLCTVFLLADTVGLAIAAATGTNLWLAYFALPLEAALVLWLLASWQSGERLKRAYLKAIPLVTTAAAVILLVTTPATSFPRWVSPLLTIVALAATLHTLVDRTLRSRLPLTEQDWFWICFGLAILWATTVLMRPFLALFVLEREEWVARAYIVRSYVLIGAFVLMAWGVACQRILPLSLGRSSALPSRW